MRRQMTRIPGSTRNEGANQPTLLDVAFFALHVKSVRKKSVTLKMTLERMSMTMALSRVSMNSVENTNLGSTPLQSYLSAVDIKGDNKSHTVSF